MKALAIIAWVIIGGVLGAFLFWNFSGLPKQEGYLAMMSVFVGGPIGAVAGVVFALKIMAKFSEQGARKFAGLSLLGAILLFVGFIALPK